MINNGPVHRSSARIVGSGEMADMVRSHDWSGTPLGPIDGWSRELTMAVNLMLATKAIATLYWGPERVMIYNDLYRPQLAHRHPALGRRLREVWPEVNDQVEVILQRTFETGQSTRIEDVHLQIELNGRSVEKVYTLHTDPLWEETEDGPRIAALYHTAIDRTAGVLAERERDEATERLSKILNVTNDGVAYLDRDWRITYLNERAKKMTTASGDVLGRNHWEAYPATVFEGSPFVEHYRRAMDERLAGEFEAYYPEPLNAWFHAFVQPVDDGIIIFFRDVTQEKKTMTALIQSEKLAAVGRLASSIAHEINNPLESVMNLLYLALSSQLLHPETRDHLETAERELRRVSVITNQTLRFYRQPTNRSCVACENLIGDALSIYQGRLVNLNIQVHKRKRALTPVVCYEGEIRQVLNNLIGNAIDAMQTCGGQLFLRSREGTDWKTTRRGLVITVADTGCGMDQATRQRIFEAFFSTKGINGTGLGLWLSQEIVARHKGSMRVRSSQRGGSRGTVFILFLPFESVGG